ESVGRALPDGAVHAWDSTILAYIAAGHLRAAAPRRFLYPIGSGTLGYAWPAALGASAAALETPALAVVGDGGLAYGLSAPATATSWGVDSEYGLLLDVLLCRPDNFHWLPTSSISKATLASGALFDRDVALRQHAEMVDAYAGAGVNVHYLEADPALPYQVYARDSSFMTPFGAVVTQMHQWW